MLTLTDTSQHNADVQVRGRVPTIIILIKSKCHVDERLNTTLMRKIISTLPPAVPQKGYMCFHISRPTTLIHHSFSYLIILTSNQDVTLTAALIHKITQSL